MPTTAVGSKPQAVSSSVSRTMASRNVSPSSRWPAGWLITTRPLARSSTRRNRPSRSATAATVTSGFHTMPVIIRNRRWTQPGSEVDGGGAQFGLEDAAGPDFVEIREVATDHGLVVELHDAVPASAVLAIGHHPVVRDDERARIAAVLGRHVAKVDVARESPRHLHEAVAFPGDSARVGDEHAQPRVAAGEHEPLERLE